jgi:XTP/dITP diphosphohydrolase
MTGNMMELVLATTNKKKIEEIQRIVHGMEIAFSTLDDYPGCPAVEEDGATFEANAVKKAVAVARYTQKPALADDSGLEVDALSGAPGTRSARYAGENAGDRQNLEKLLNVLGGIEEKKRGARFVCCIALASNDGSINTFYGYAEGRIGMSPKGENGFGYDPVFYPNGHERTFAEMTAQEKDALSHRGNALKKLASHLKTRIRAK